MIQDFFDKDNLKLTKYGVNLKENNSNNLKTFLDSFFPETFPILFYLFILMGKALMKPIFIWSTLHISLSSQLLPF